MLCVIGCRDSQEAAGHVRGLHLKHVKLASCTGNAAVKTIRQKSNIMAVMLKEGIDET